MVKTCKKHFRQKNTLEFLTGGMAALGHEEKFFFYFLYFLFQLFFCLVFLFILFIYFLVCLSFFRALGFKTFLKRF